MLNGEVVVSLAGGWRKNIFIFVKLHACVASNIYIYINIIC